MTGAPLSERSDSVANEDHKIFLDPHRLLARLLRGGCSTSRFSPAQSLGNLPRFAIGGARAWRGDHPAGHVRLDGVVSMEGAVVALPELTRYPNRIHGVPVPKRGFNRSPRWPT